MKDWMPLIDEYYYCTSDLTFLRRISDEKLVQTLPLSSDHCSCCGFRLCIYTRNGPWSTTYSLRPMDISVPCCCISEGFFYSSRPLFVLPTSGVVKIPVKRLPPNFRFPQGSSEIRLGPIHVKTFGSPTFGRSRTRFSHLTGSRAW